MNRRLPLGSPFLIRIEEHLLSASLRARLLRERATISSSGWTVPAVSEILRQPTAFEIPMMVCRFLDHERSTVLVDVGANTGYWAERFLRFVPAEYIAVEPDPQAFADLTARFPGRTLHHAAAGSAAGALELQVAAESVYSTLSAYRSDSHISTEILRQVTVDVLTLDSLVISGDQLIVKIDVQGFEAHVLRGASKLLDKVDVVILEAPLWSMNATDNDFGLLVSLLQPHGLSPRYFGLPGLHVHRAPIPVEFDVIFARGERRP